MTLASVTTELPAKPVFPLILQSPWCLQLQCLQACDPREISGSVSPGAFKPIDAQVMIAHLVVSRKVDVGIADDEGQLPEVPDAAVSEMRIAVDAHPDVLVCHFRGYIPKLGQNSNLIPDKDPANLGLIEPAKLVVSDGKAQVPDVGACVVLEGSPQGVCEVAVPVYLVVLKEMYGDLVVHLLVYRRHGRELAKRLLDLGGRLGDRQAHVRIRDGGDEAVIVDLEADLSWQRVKAEGLEFLALAPWAMSFSYHLAWVLSSCHPGPAQWCHGSDFMGYREEVQKWEGCSSGS